MKKNQDYKNAALAALKGNWSPALLAVLVYIVISGIAVTPNIISQMQLALNPSASGFFASNAGATSAFVYLMELLVIYPLAKGFINAFNRLLVNGNNELTRGMLNSTLLKYWRTVLATLLQFIYILLWSLLLVIPGIIKSLAYSMTWFILEDEPELSPNKAIELSMAMMKGHKFDLFYLMLSFIGWAVLSVFTLGIGFLWLLPYIYTTMAAFYQDVKAEYIAGRNLQTEPAAAPAPVQEQVAEAPAIKDVKTENPEDYMPR